VALASNIGGMTSPISSPQNIFAIERMSMDGDPPSWLSWFAIALPVSFIRCVRLVLCVLVHVYVGVYMFICVWRMCMCIWVCTYSFVCACACVCGCVHVHLCMAYVHVFV